MANDKTTPATTSTTTKPARERRPQASLSERMKSQLSMAALRSKITIEEIQMLESHCVKLRGLLA
jgi:hypothetical protein